MRRRVLIVEDDDASARLLQDNLVYEGFEVERAGTTSEAYGKVKSFVPDLVLLDVMLVVRGLDLGADDYVMKPFAFEELLARMRAVMRRRESRMAQLRIGSVVVDFRARRATRDGRDVGLTHRELEMVQYLAERPGELVTRDDLLHSVWGYLDAPLTRSVDIAIARLRRKIEPDPHRPRYIRTLHGNGYGFTPDGNNKQ